MPTPLSTDVRYYIWRICLFKYPLKFEYQLTSGALSKSYHRNIRARSGHNWGGIARILPNLCICHSASEIISESIRYSLCPAAGRIAEIPDLLKATPSPSSLARAISTYCHCGFDIHESIGIRSSDRRPAGGGLKSEARDCNFSRRQFRAGGRCAGSIGLPRSCPKSSCRGFGIAPPASCRKALLAT